jgi:hypothetical protein
VANNVQIGVAEVALSLIFPAGISSIIGLHLQPQVEKVQMPTQQFAFSKLHTRHPSWQGIYESRTGHYLPASKNKCAHNKK